MNLKLVFPCARGTERAVAFEVEALGAVDVKRSRGAVLAMGDASVVARANVFLRAGNRVLIEAVTGDASSADALKYALSRVKYETFIGPDDTFAITAHLEDGAPLDHSHYAALTVKDAIVDRFRDQGRERPNVDTKNPRVRLFLHLASDTFTLSLDTSGAPLHRRGYRRELGEAPMKETLAAAILAIGPADPRRPFIDPCCGSGTLAIEQALRVLDRAPNGGRPFAIDDMQHDVFQLRAPLRLAREEARDRAKNKLDVDVRMSDWHPKAVFAATQNIEAAGLTGIVSVEQVDVRKQHLDVPGIVVAANLPFGERLGKENRLQLEGFYRTLGDKLRALKDARILLFSSVERTDRLVNLGEPKRTSLPSGKLPSMLFRFDVGGRERPPRPVVED